MRRFRQMSSTTGWFNESHRHSLASRGIKTVWKKTNPKGRDFTVYDVGKGFEVRTSAGDYDSPETVLAKKKSKKEAVAMAEKRSAMAVKFFEDDLILRKWKKGFSTHTIAKQTGMTEEEVEKHLGKVAGVYFPKPEDLKNSSMAGKEEELIEIKDSDVVINMDEGYHKEVERLKSEGKDKKSEVSSSEVRRIVYEAGFKDPYALSYVNELDTAEAMYGTQGVKAQIAYIVSNLRAKTPEQKEAKAKLKGMMKY